MFSLTLREQFLVAGLLCAFVTGVAVKHWRDARRETAATSTASASGGTSGHVPAP